MRALVLTGPSRFELTEVPVPVPDAGEVLVRVRACGICGSDVHGMDGSTGRRRPPIIMGHEAAGEVAGDHHADWPAGARVTFDSTVFCGHCTSCRAGQINLCEQRRVLGVSCEEYRHDGAFAEFVSVPARTLHRLPAGLTFEAAALAEPVSVAMHAINRSSLARPGAKVVVIGAGLIGLLLIQALRARGIDCITAVDVDVDRLALACRLGAASACDARQPGCGERLARLDADVAFEVVGLSATLQNALAATRRGGDVVLVGNLATTVDFPLQAVVTRELHILGSCASAGEYPAALELLASGRINTAAMISAAVPLSDGADWFRRLHAREAGLLKVLLQP